MKKQNNKRPKHLNLIKIRMPVSAVVSILHRVSGIVLFFSIPYIIWLFSLSVKTPDSFNYALTILSSDWGKLVNVLLLWAITHHFFAGIRFLLLDIDVAISREATIKMAWFTQAIILVTFLLLLFKVVL